MLGKPRMRATVKGKTMGKSRRKLRLRERKTHSALKRSITVHAITVAIPSKTIAVPMNSIKGKIITLGS